MADEKNVFQPSPHVKDRKERSSMNLDDSAASKLLKPQEIYVDVELMNKHFSIRSFAFGGMPYFEMDANYDQETVLLVKDIIAGKLTPQVCKLFEGIDTSGIGDSITCYITDSRSNMSVKSTVHLVKPTIKSDTEFTVNHVKKLSDSNLGTLF